MLVTPDMNLSDIWHLNYPIKNFLSESIRQGSFPLWTDMIGNGYPIAAEGQIGAFSPLNWVFFGLFPMPLAFSVALYSSFAIMAIGSYLVGRLMRLTKVQSLSAGIFASTTGYLITHMTHLNLMQSFSFIPWAFLFFEKWQENKHPKELLWMALFLSQMILVGYPQTFINTVVLLVALLLVRRRQQFVKLGVRLAASVVLALAMAAVQLLPLFELVSVSDTIGAAQRQRYIHPLPIKYLLNLINPFIFGNPSVGTFPGAGPGQPVYWESLIYLGVVPLVILTMVAMLTVRRLTFKSVGSRRYFGIFLVALVSLVLALGKSTPLGIMFKLPPLSFTRIESRFLAFSTWALGLLAAIALAGLMRRFKLSKNLIATVIILLMVLHFTEIIWTFRGYHLFVEDEKWLSVPNTATRLPPTARILSFSQENIWSQISPIVGWRGKEKLAIAARETLGPNSNLVFGVKQLGAYAQQYSRRYDYIRHNMYRLDSLGENIRAAYGVTHILDASSSRVQIIPQARFAPDIRVATRVIQVRDADEALGRLNQESFSPLADVLWESPRRPGEGEKVVIVNRSFYPGWVAEYQGQKLQIYPVNINQQGVIVPKDANIQDISFRFFPMSVLIGGLISVLSFGGWLVLMHKIV